jgi:hypothetical protein
MTGIGGVLDDLADIHSLSLQEIGTSIGVRRRGPNPKNFTLTGVSIQELRPEEVAKLRVEGTINASDARPVMFIFPGTADIAEATDSIVWASWEWKVLSIVPTPGQTKYVNKRALCIRRVLA